MVGMTRAHIADPHIVAKLERGEEDRIRPCVGMGYCIDRIYVGARTRSASTTRPPAARRPCRTSCRPADGAAAQGRGVGGGAGGHGGGARVGALRGHEVVLLEATDRLGGQINLAAKADRRARRSPGITGWLQPRSSSPGVEVRLNSYAEADDVLALAAGRRDRRHRRPAQHRASSETGEDLVASGLGRAGRLCRARRAACWSTTTTASTRGRRSPSVLAEEGRRRSSCVTPGSDAGVRGRRHQLPALLRELYRRGVKLDARSGAALACGATATGWWPPSGTMYTEETVESGWSITSSSSTARCRRTSCTTRSRTGSRNGGEIDVEGLADGHGRRRSSRNPDGPLPAVPGRRRGLRRATSMRRSTTALRLCKSL